MKYIYIVFIAILLFALVGKAQEFSEISGDWQKQDNFVFRTSINQEIALNDKITFNKTTKTKEPLEIDLSGTWCNDGICLEVTQYENSIYYTNEMQGWTMKGAGVISGNKVYVMQVQKKGSCVSRVAITWTVTSTTKINFTYLMLDNDECGSVKGSAGSASYTKR
jgi:hypothetical protein